MLRHPTSPTGAGSKICLEVMPIDSVTLSDGRGLEERTPTRRYVRFPDTPDPAGRPNITGR